MLQKQRMMNSQKQPFKKILFGISGGIAAYKTPDIIHGLIKAGYEVEVIMTSAAEAFVSPLAISTLTGRQVWRESDFLASGSGWKIPHISLAEWADVFVVAPCTANLLSIFATGGAATLMGATYLACTAPVLLFPAMNTNMLSNPATVANLETLRSRGCLIAEAESGMLACGCEGKGRLPGNSAIYEHIKRALTPVKDLSGKRVLITAGPTHEYIDPVRYISNPSSGRMGFALAREAWCRGAEVTLVTGPVSITAPAGVKVVPVVTAEEMYNACMEFFPQSDITIKSAAVGDFRAEKAENKIKRQPGENMVLELYQNRDIARELGKIKKENQLLVGFAAETENIIENANKKIVSKNLDYVAVNNVLAEGAGFACDTNAVFFISRAGESVELSGTKDEVAEGIFDVLAGRK